MTSVYLASCERYDADLIAGHVRAASAALGVSLPTNGTTLVHASLPWAHPRYAPDAHTHPAVIEGIVRSLAGGVTVGAQSLPGFPTRYSFAKAGYDKLARRIGTRLVAFDEGEFRPVSSPRSQGSTIPLPGLRLDAPFTVAAPRISGSGYLPFAGALRQLYSLLPADVQLAEQHHMSDLIAVLAAVAAPSLIVVDAVQPLHQGGELSGEPVDLGVLIMGTDPVAVDLACAAAYGVPEEDLEFVRFARQTADQPSTFADVEVMGDLPAAELRDRASRIQRFDRRPERPDLPAQVKVLRSPKASPTGVAGSLSEAWGVLSRASIELAKARESVLVIGQVEDVPPAASDTAAIIFMDDTSRADFKGYTRIVRLTGRTPAVSRILMDVPFVLNVANLRADLGFGFALARIRGRLSRILGGPGRPRGAAGRPSAPKGGGDPAAEKG
jgi:uncharacterized protein (DUF362 family)